VESKPLAFLSALTLEAISSDRGRNHCSASVVTRR